MDMSRIHMLEAVTDPPASSWLLAPMPDASLYQLREAVLCALDGAGEFRLSDALSSRFETALPTDEILIARDSDGVFWRLRRLGAPNGLRLWRLQSIEDTRKRLLDRLRITLAPRVATHLLHDLRNPMNALSLHADLAAQILAMRGGTAAESERMASSLRIIKERLRDLQGLQNRAVALWLGIPPEASAATTAGAVFSETLRLLRGILARPQVHLNIDDLELLNGCPVAVRALPSLQLSLIAVLMMVSATPDVPQTPATVRQLRAHADTPACVILDIDAHFHSASLESHLDATDIIGVFAALALLLEEYGIDINVVATGARFVFPRSAN
jgi:signal transduction histidine kinase